MARLIVLGLLLAVVWNLTARWLRTVGRPSAADKEPPATRSPHEVLGVRPDASPQEIKSAYRDKIAQYHPDRLEGMAPDLLALANERTRELNDAYARLRRRR